MWAMALYCISAECGSSTPPARHAYIVRPEQSKLSGPAAAHWYGLPNWALAVFTAVAAPALTGGAGPPGAGDGGDDVGLGAAVVGVVAGLAVVTGPDPEPPAGLVGAATPGPRGATLVAGAAAGAARVLNFCWPCC